MSTDSIKVYDDVLELGVSVLEIVNEEFGIRN